MDGATLWSLLLFVVIFLLGIDSAFSLLEAASTVIHDQLGHIFNRTIISGVLSIVGCAFSAIYCLDIGLNIFDVVDHYLNTYIMLIIGIFECVAVGWFYKFEVLKETLTPGGAYLASMGYWVSLIVGVILGFHVFFDAGLVWIGILVWLAGWALSWGIAYGMASKNGCTG